MHLEACRSHFTSARVATLATIGAKRPHLVPIVFALKGDRIFTAVDHKPKRSRSLQRISNIRANPAVAVLADNYDEDWTQLWWVRADGVAQVVVNPVQMKEGIDSLVAKYDHYENNRPSGPLLEIVIDRWSGWSGASV